jgi:hypothetical protein
MYSNRRKNPNEEDHAVAYLYPDSRRDDVKERNIPGDWLLASRNAGDDPAAAGRETL